jgi:hypothetical protein
VIVRVGNDGVVLIRRGGFAATADSAADGDRTSAISRCRRDHGLRRLRSYHQYLLGTLMHRGLMASYPNGERKSGDVMKVAAVTSQASLDLTASWVVGDRPEDILERVAA